MNTHRFEQWQDKALLHGQHALSDVLRELVHRTDPQSLDRMDFEDDHAFLSPQLFAHFTLTGHGRMQDAVAGEASDGIAPAIPIGPNWLCLAHIPQIFARLFTAEGHTMPHLVSPAWAKRHQMHALRAWHLISRHCKRLAKRLQDSTRHVYLFHACQPHSFASLSAHGAMFLNVPNEADEVFFLEDMAHQGAHVAFNAMTHDKARYFRVKPHLPMSELLGDAAETRSVYSVFHALYTYVLIADVLGAVLEAGVLDGRQTHELRGRLAYNLLKFRIDLQNLNQPSIFTAKGQLLYRRFMAHCLHHSRRHEHVVRGLDLSNQPYNFSYAHFVQSNLREELQWSAA